MTQLTEERFTQILTEKLSPIPTRAELQKAVEPLATRHDVREGVEELARITSDGFARTEERFDEVERRLDISEQMKAFERKFQKLEEALQITL